MCGRNGSGRRRPPQNVLQVNTGADLSCIKRESGAASGPEPLHLAALWAFCNLERTTCHVYERANICYQQQSSAAAAGHRGLLLACIFWGLNVRALH